MPQLKTKRIGRFQITKFPKAVWVRSLPYGTTVKRFKTFKEAEKFVEKKQRV